MEVRPVGAGDFMEAKQREMVRKILEFNRDYRLSEDRQRGFRNEGQKDRCYAELRIFNGQPQLVFFYGKRRYTFLILPRDEPDTMKALKRVKGFKGIQAIPPEILKDLGFSKETLALWAEMLEEWGV